MSKPDSSTPPGGLIDRDTLAARWCCSIETIKRIEKRGKLPRVQLGPRAVRYHLCDVLKIEGERSLNGKEVVA
jgi:hypothetical protein